MKAVYKISGDNSVVLPNPSASSVSSNADLGHTKSKKTSENERF